MATQASKPVQVACGSGTPVLQLAVLSARTPHTSSTHLILLLGPPTVQKNPGMDEGARAKT